MADISTELQAILDAVYGEEVRDSIHDAIELINDVGEVVLTIGTAVTSASSSVDGYYDGSLYINNSTWVLWKCDGSAWESQGVIRGDDGVSVTSIDKTSTSGLVDTYTITYSDATTTTFDVTNGNGVSDISKTSTADLVDTYTIAFTDGTSTTFDVTNGKGISTIAKTSTSGLTDTYTITYNDSTTTTFDVENGVGISSVDKTATVGLIDTYTITFNDSTTTTFTVTNGTGISFIDKTSTADLVDTYTITLTDGTTTTFTVTNGEDGNGISSIDLTSGTHAAGTLDTYTITYTDGTTSTMQVYNGADGTGAGDMTKTAYDPNETVLNAGGIEAYVEAHTDEVVNSQAGAHGLRYYNDELSYYDEDTSTWVEIQTGGGTTIVQVPTASSSTYTYDGTTQEYTFDSIDTTYITVSGNYQTNAGTYTVTCTLKDADYVWSDLTTAAKTYTWTINPLSITTPVATSTTYTYDGTAQTFSFSTLDTSHITVSGNTQTDAGTYTVTCALNDASNYIWDDSTTADKTYSWTINKAQGAVSFSPASVTLDADTTTVTLVPTITGDGAITYSGYDANIITMAGNVVTATQTTGTTTITATLSETTNYLGATATISVTASFIALVAWSSGTDAEIQTMLDAYYNGELTLANIQSVWSVGDVRNITVSAMAATGVGESHREQTVQMVILDFDHDTLTTSINGKTKALITVQTKDCLMDEDCADGTAYGKNNTENGYMNSTSTNVGGWTSCARRTWCNDVLYAALPSGFKNMVKQANHSTTEGDQGSSLETTADYCFLLSEWEITGAISKAAAQEGTQYEYYETTANRYKLPAWSSSVTGHIWWGRTPYAGDSIEFFAISSSANPGNYTAYNTAIGLAPACCI